MCKQLVSKVGELLTLPDVYWRLRELLDQPQTDYEKIGLVLSHDPALSARLLKIVNSSLYAFPKKIDSIKQALSMVGTQELESLILATSAKSLFEKISSDLIDLSSYWHHSVYTGISAQIIARRISFHSIESLFAAGLLHDVGQLVIFQHLPELGQTILQKAPATDDGLYHTEKEILGFNHGNVGAELFRNWRLPDLFCEVAEFHHEPEFANLYPTETAIIHLANSLANRIEPTANITDCRSTCHPIVFSMLNLSEDDTHEIIEATENQFSEVIKIISPDGPLI